MDDKEWRRLFNEELLKQEQILMAYVKKWGSGIYVLGFFTGAAVVYISQLIGWL